MIQQTKEKQTELNRRFNKLNNEIEILLGIASQHVPLEQEPENLILHVKDSQERYDKELNRLQNIIYVLNETIKSS